MPHCRHCRLTPLMMPHMRLFTTPLFLRWPYFRCRHDAIISLPLRHAITIIYARYFIFLRHFHLFDTPRLRHIAIADADAHALADALMDITPHGHFAITHYFRHLISSSHRSRHCAYAITLFTPITAWFFCFFFAASFSLHFMLSRLLTPTFQKPFHFCH